MNRPDAPWLAEMVKKKYMTIADAKNWVKLPLLAIPSNDNSQYPGWFEFQEEQTERDKDISDYGEVFKDEFFIFRDFLFIMENDAYGRITINKLNNFLLTVIDKKLRTFTTIIGEHVVHDGFDGLVTMPLVLKGYPKNTDLKRFTETDKSKQHIATVFVNVLMKCMFFIRFSNQCDKYAVSVKSTKEKKRTVKSTLEVLEREIGPRIIYLNQLPSEDLTDEENTEIIQGNAKRPHHRRGCFKTLMADRFKNHPLYQVEKGLYVKPTWIGDKSKIVHGNIYTILETTQPNYD